MRHVCQEITFCLVGGSRLFQGINDFRHFHKQYMQSGNSSVPHHRTDYNLPVNFSFPAACPDQIGLRRLSLQHFGTFRYKLVQLFG